MQTAVASSNTTRTGVLSLRFGVTAGTYLATRHGPRGGLLVRRHAEQGLGRLRHGGTVVLAQQRRNRAGDLRLRDVGHVVSLAKRRRVRADDGDPDVFRSFLLDTMILPLFHAMPAAVIGADDKGRLILVFGHRLHELPQGGHIAVKAVCRLKHEVVAPAVRYYLVLETAHSFDSYVPSQAR